MLTQQNTATTKEGTDIPLRSLTLEKIHSKLSSNTINKLFTSLGGSFCSIYSQIQVMPFWFLLYYENDQFMLLL